MLKVIQKFMKIEIFLDNVVDKGIIFMFYSRNLQINQEKIISSGKVGK